VLYRVLAAPRWSGNDLKQEPFCMNKVINDELKTEHETVSQTLQLQHEAQVVNF
jgi:hypothetical protein